MTSRTCRRCSSAETPVHNELASGAPEPCTNGTSDGHAVAACAEPAIDSIIFEGCARVERGLTERLSSTYIRQEVRSRALVLANRFRVVRTLDVAVACFPERGFKAALTAAQRAMRGLVQDGLLRRYRTDRMQTVYGLTQRGANCLQDLNLDGTASLRRVSEMSNPEHRLWAQFLTLCAEARGLQAWTEAELMQLLNRRSSDGKTTVQGLLQVNITTSSGTRSKVLRPDALIQEEDGATLIEIDRSIRGSERAADLRALAHSVGSELCDGQVLRRVVIFTRNDRIRSRVLATLGRLADDLERAALMRGRRQLHRTSDGEFAVTVTVNRRHSDRRVSLVDIAGGHVIVQPLPTWLPKFRLDGRGTNSEAGWMGENYLPYRRPEGLGGWDVLASPLLVGKARTG